MSNDETRDFPDADDCITTAELKTELTLGLPGDAADALKSGSKRRFSEAVGFKLSTSYEDGEVSVSTPPPSKAKVGWPPVRSYRKNMMMKNCKYVKVAVDGAPYLRKIDLEICTNYQQLLAALETMFSCLTICDEMKIMDPANGTKYVPTYEDRDGDWMMIGDVPWKMFVESCRRMRLMKSLEARGLAPKACPKGSGMS